MFPDAKWLDALKLPIRLKLAIIAACGTLYYLIQTEKITLGPLDPLLSTLLLVGAVVFGIVVVFDGAAWAFRPIAEKRKLSTLSKRRKALRDDREAERGERRATILKELERLSRWEVRVIAEVIEGGSPTFYHYVHSPAVTMLQAKHLVWSPGGPHHQDHYPFNIADFVWEELMARKDEFLAKEAAFKAQEVANKRAGKADPW